MERTQRRDEFIGNMSQITSVSADECRIIMGMVEGFGFDDLDAELRDGNLSLYVRDRGLRLEAHRIAVTAWA